MSAEVHDHEHHHKQNFISKYIFSLDHKMIAKQYLITGIIMGIIGVGMSLLFRMQLAGQRNLLGFLTYYLVISGRQTAL
jgi:cytochrome c oxidase subunit 1